MDEKKRCKAKSKQSGERCKNAATKGKEVCRIHGGLAGRPIVHGRYSVKASAALQEKIEHFRADPSAGDLRDELAILRALLQDYLDRLVDPIDDPVVAGVMVNHVFGMVEAIGKMVERIAKILATTALTQAELKLLQVTLIDALNEYVPNPEHRRAFVSRVFGTLRGVSNSDTGSRVAIADIAGVAE